MRTEKLTLKEKSEIIDELNDHTSVEEISKSYNISKVSIWRIWNNYLNAKSSKYNCNVCNKVVKFDKVWGKNTSYMYGNMCLNCLKLSNERFIEEQNRWLNKGTDEEKDEKLCQMYMDNGFFDKKEDWSQFKKWLERE